MANILPNGGGAWMRGAWAAGVVCLAWMGAPCVQAQVVNYEARLEGVADEALLVLLQSASDTLALTGTPPPSLLQLERRAEQDLPRFETVFQSQGYYGAIMTYRIDEEAEPVQAVFEAAPGTQYRLAEVRVEFLQAEPPPAEVVPTPGEIGVVPGAPALAGAIAEGNGKALALLRERGYPTPDIAKRDVVVDHETETVAVTYHVVSGARAVYGPVRIEGLVKVKPVVVNARVPWEAGETYDQRDLLALRNRLYDTNLFSTVAVQPDPDAEDADAEGVVPIVVSVTERPSRTINVGLEYKTDEGPGAQFSWEQRNIGGLGHKLTIGASLATQLRNVTSTYRIDRFRRPDQGLTLSGEIAQEDREAYAGERLLASAMLDRKVRPSLTLGGGVGLRISQVEQNDEKGSYAFLFFPFEARLDRSDDLLNPTRGFRARGRIEPYVGGGGGAPLFFKADGEVSHYLRLGRFVTAEGEELDNWVLASRLRLSSILGAERDDLPADIRLYAGGGGSIRGYAYQMVSPLNEADEPLGGLALGELSVEMRKRLTKNIGLVAFVDGGSVADEALPTFSTPQWGAGVGLRYFTPLGPLRFDVAAPLNPREIDARVQIYISIGQAF